MLFAPELQRDMLNCLLDVAKHIGWLPDAWITGYSTKVQGGSSADILFNEAALKQISGIDYASALGYMRKNNEIEPADPYIHGRYLADYRDLGFVSTDAVNCVSRHLEYSYQDWCIGRLAEQIGQSNVAEQYYKSAAKLWNLWHPDLLHFAPKTPRGDWAQPFDINYARPDSCHLFQPLASSKGGAINIQSDDEAPPIKIKKAFSVICNRSILCICR